MLARLVRLLFLLAGKSSGVLSLDAKVCKRDARQLAVGRQRRAANCISRYDSGNLFSEDTGLQGGAASVLLVHIVQLMCVISFVGRVSASRPDASKLWPPRQA